MVVLLVLYYNIDCFVWFGFLGKALFAEFFFGKAARFKDIKSSRKLFLLVILTACRSCVAFSLKSFFSVDKSLFLFSLSAVRFCDCRFRVCFYGC